MAQVFLTSNQSQYTYNVKITDIEEGLDFIRFSLAIQKIPQFRFKSQQLGLGLQRKRTIVSQNYSTIQNLNFPKYVHYGNDYKFHRPNSNLCKLSLALMMV